MLLLKNALFLIGLITHEILASFNPPFLFLRGCFYFFTFLTASKKIAPACSNFKTYMKFQT
ncbi:hypothetical protein [Helicobacter pylori]|uniref:hypothetical protein n=1 Tax=Helicobacter pylori TaxID=210 RepID=UPI0002BA5403|nr:hypothetical protein [Helicobacter pylori]EMH09851.1 hypothetical protein HMPREF1411_00776 [Helicobacter pylori GAM250AFi]EMH12653.1 hypothetical protein HMPREF1412_01288 [Helicobacter pylori GAM250T]EMH15025.1 hypothetical protein HMPREF1414_00745 [Helicobacter pylori GAM252T]EMH15984.1 hypothetical protein HMPREF1413_00290 [Helicobacter pylori GAM252Bi]EMH45766.1 hypothetical protein HMPREF1439_01642 [Helicobacter pylori HP250AFiii]